MLSIAPLSQLVRIGAVTCCSFMRHMVVVTFNQQAKKSVSFHLLACHHPRRRQSASHACSRFDRASTCSCRRSHKTQSLYSPCLLDARSPPQHCTQISVDRYPPSSPFSPLLLFVLLGLAPQQSKHCMQPFFKILLAYIGCVIPSHRGSNIRCCTRRPI